MNIAGINQKQYGKFNKCEKIATKIGGWNIKNFLNLVNL